MLSLMNTSDIPNFTPESSEKPRRSDARVSELRVDGSSGVSDGKREAFSKMMPFKKDIDSSAVVRVNSDNKMEARVSTDVRKFSGNARMEKLTMREDDLARVYVKSDDGKQVPLRPVVSDFGSAYAMVDEGAAARMSEAFGSEAAKALSYGFEPGDMVWGKVKSHPWWPGHIFHEAFCSSSVRRSKREGHLLVAFFGDGSYGWFDPAELIPFEPHYAEKSRQTTSRAFIRAVDEAVDEASRRSALGLTCRCRNPFNFRPSSVHSYFGVDVIGNETGSVYSVMQIKKSRERFKPEEALDFVQQLALSPMSFEMKSLDAIRNRATMISYRKAVFEEFDETYAQAFGMQPVRPSHAELDQNAQTPIRASLTGPTMVAESSDQRKSILKSELKSFKVKEQSKKDKYLFKRRDEADEPKSNNVAQGTEGVVVSSPPKEGIPTTLHEDYVLQKRISVPKADVEVKQDVPGAVTRVDNLGRGVRREGSDSVHEQAIKRLKTSKEEEISRKSAGKSVGIGLPTEKSELDFQPRDNGSSSASLSSDSASSLQKGSLDNVEVEVDPPQVANSALSPQTGGFDNLEVGLPQVINDMLALALDPFHGIERNSAAVVRHVLLRFRSLVYQKSLVLSGSEAESSESLADRTPASTVSEIPAREDVRAVAPRHPRHIPRPDDPTKAGRKRSVSDRQEEMSSKRLKKISALKSLAAEKKSGSQKIPEVQRGQIDSAVGKSMRRSEAAARGGEQPAMLVMKFLQQSRMPSGPELKARFGRFGLLSSDLIRVYYNSNTCRVVFTSRAGAEAAYNFAVGNTALFGDKVTYQVKDYGGQASSEVESVKSKGNGNLEEAPQLRAVGGSDAGGRVMTPVQQSRAQNGQQLKSCLKKQASGEEVGGSSVSVAREIPRVKFMLGGEESRLNNKETNKSGGTTTTSADGGASSSSSTIGMMDVNSKNFQKVIPQTSSSPHMFPFPYPPPPPPPRIQDVVHESRQVGYSQIKIEQKIEPVNSKNYINSTTTTTTTGTSSSTTTSATTTPPTMSMMNNNKKVDISHQMLTLLMRCNDIVADVKCTFGYMPYHPL